MYSTYIGLIIKVRKNISKILLNTLWCYFLSGFDSTYRKRSTKYTFVLSLTFAAESKNKQKNTIHKICVNKQNICRHRYVHIHTWRQRRTHANRISCKKGDPRSKPTTIASHEHHIHLHTTKSYHVGDLENERIGRRKKKLVMKLQRYSSKISKTKLDTKLSGLIFM